METTNDIIKEMRDSDGVDSYGWFTRKHVLDWADRIEAAWRRDMMAFMRWMKERHNFNVLDEEIERCAERELEREYGDY